MASVPRSHNPVGEFIRLIQTNQTPTMTLFVDMGGMQGIGGSLCYGESRWPLSAPRAQAASHF